MKEEKNTIDLELKDHPSRWYKDIEIGKDLRCYPLAVVSDSLRLAMEELITAFAILAELDKQDERRGFPLNTTSFYGEYSYNSKQAFKRILPILLCIKEGVDNALGNLPEHPAEIRRNYDFRLDLNSLEASTKCLKMVADWIEKETKPAQIEEAVYNIRKNSKCTDECKNDGNSENDADAFADGLWTDPKKNDN